MEKFIKKNKIRSLSEMEELGWIKRPKAKEFYLNNPTLQKKYITYDRYANACYNNVKSGWNSAGTVQLEQGRSSHKPRGILSTEAQKTEKIEENIYRKAIKSSITLHKNERKFEKYKEFNQEKDLKIKHFSPKKPKSPKNNYRQKNTICPYCLSTLVLNTVKTWECTGDRLKLWETEFLKYNQLSIEEKTNYMLNFSHPGLFLDLYEKWNYIEDGRRVRFSCEYSNKIFNPISRFRTTLYDPIMVKCIEKSLGRKLLLEEKEGEVDLYREGRTFFKDFKRGRVKVKIPQITYPDGFMI